MVGSGCAELNPAAEQEPLPRLGPVQLVNADDVVHELSVRIEREGTEVFSNSYQLESSPDGHMGGGRVDIECGVGAERARYSLEFETGAGKSTSIGLDRGDGPTLLIRAMIDGDAEVGILTGGDSYETLCDDPASTPE